MRIFKNHPILKLINSYLIDAPQPSNISYLWNFGSLLGLCLVVQIITGVTLAMHYNSGLAEAFNSVEHIMRDVGNGWLIRYLHSNTASAFFFLVYLHIGRGLYYGSYKIPRTLVWAIGTVIFILLMAIAFLGYYYSLIWYELFSSIFTNLNNIINNNIFICIFSWAFIISFILLYLNDFKLSKISIIKYIQMFSFISAPFVLFFYAYNISINIDIINYVKDNDNNINLHGHAHISLSKEAGKTKGQGLSTVGSEVGLGATMVGVAGAVAKVITKSSLPPVQKAGIKKMKFNNNTLKKLLEQNQLRPVYIYENLHLDETRKVILKETKNLSGIYLIFNKITEDYYIGSASTNRFYARFSNHLLYFKGSKTVKNAVRKYKLDNFAFLILELFPEIVNQENNKKLLDLEDFYLKSLLPNYNILTEAGSSFGYKHTELARIKMKNNFSLDRREHITNLNKDKKLSLETIEKLKKSALTRKKFDYSEKSLLNMKRNSKPIILYNLNHTVFGEYASIIEAANSINCNAKTIRRALKTDKNILKRRFIVKFKNWNT